MDVTLIAILAAAFLAAVIAGGVLIATHEAELRSLETWEDAVGDRWEALTPPRSAKRLEDDVTPAVPITSIRRVK